VADVLNLRHATAERAVAARRARLVEALRPLLLPDHDPEHAGALRRAALLRALSQPERRADPVGNLARDLDAAFLPATLPDAYADLLDVLLRVERLQAVVRASRDGDPDAAERAWAALEPGDLGGVP
jgi:hypothetical protein